MIKAILHQLIQRRQAQGDVLEMGHNNLVNLLMPISNERRLPRLLFHHSAHKDTSTAIQNYTECLLVGFIGNMGK